MKRIVFAALAFATLSGCLKDKSSNYTCSYNECSVVAPASEIQQVKDYLAANNIANATQHCSGLFYTVDDPGSGAPATACSYVAFSYEGKLTNGTVFDKSTQPITGNLSGFIRGFQNGLPKIKAGGRMHLYIPPTLGYGNCTSCGTVPPNSVLIFDVNLVGVQ